MTSDVPLICDADEAHVLHKEACEYDHWHVRWLKADSIEDEIRRIEALPSGDYDADVRKREELASLRNELAALLAEPGEDAQASGAAETGPSTAEVKPTSRKQTLQDWLMPYLTRVYRGGTYRNWKAFQRALAEQAGTDGSPFKAGTGRTSDLFVVERGQSLAGSTLANWMPRVRREAAGK